MPATSEVMLLISSCGRVGEPQGILPEIDSLPVRFWSQVDRSGGPVSCWPWIGSVDVSEGYGSFHFAGRSIGAHRQACILAHGAPPAPRMQACHDPIVCVTRLCCNPAHLRWDSHAGNMADTAITGVRKGEKNPNSSITAALALAIWQRRDEGAVALGVAFGVGYPAARAILRGLSWAHVTGASAEALKPRRGRPPGRKTVARLTGATLLLLALSAVGCRRSDRCVDSAEIVGPAENMRDCAPGARVEVREVSAVGERRQLMTCICPLAQTDGGR